MRAISVVCALCGCTGDGGETDDTIQPADDVEPPDDTGTTPEDTGPDIEGGDIDASYWAVTGRFVFDQDTTQHISYAVPEVGLVSMSLEFMLIDSSWLVTQVLDDTTRCLVTFEWDTPRPIAGWVEPHTAWTGLDMPTDATVRDQCSEFFSLNNEWEDDAAANLLDWGWAVGITELDPTVEDTVRNSISPSEWSAIEPYIVGGALFSNFFAGTDLSDDGYTASGFTLGFSVDSNFEVEVDGIGSPKPLSNAYVNSDPGVITGMYEVRMGPYTGGTLLAAGEH
jgi:hypothetical protein